MITKYKLKVIFSQKLVHWPQTAEITTQLTSFFLLVFFNMW